MGGITYLYWTGARVTPWMFYVLTLLDRDLFRLFGVHVIVTSGIRTHQEQIDIFLSRYVTAGNIRGRKVYDTRIWNGTRYYRISAYGTVAVPGSSNHEIQGTFAAVDLSDTGGGPGIGTWGSLRSNWLRANAGAYDMDPEGFNFAEAWHYRVRNIFKTPPAAPAPDPIPVETTLLEELMALKSAVLIMEKASAGFPATAYDFETGFRTSWQSDQTYSRSLATVLTEGGASSITESHYNKISADFDAFFAAKRAHELAVAKAGVPA